MYTFVVFLVLLIVGVATSSVTVKTYARMTVSVTLVTDVGCFCSTWVAALLSAGSFDCRSIEQLLLSSCQVLG